MDSKNGEKIQVPVGLTDVTIRDLYDLPPQEEDAQVSIVPPI